MGQDAPSARRTRAIAIGLAVHALAATSPTGGCSLARALLSRRLETSRGVTGTLKPSCPVPYRSSRITDTRGALARSGLCGTATFICTTCRPLAPRRRHRRPTALRPRHVTAPRCLPPKPRPAAVPPPWRRGCGRVKRRHLRSARRLLRRFRAEAAAALHRLGWHRTATAAGVAADGRRVPRQPPRPRRHRVATSAAGGGRCIRGARASRQRRQTRVGACGRAIGARAS